MNGYTMEVFAEARRTARLEEVERRRLLRAIDPDQGDGTWPARWLFAPVQHVRPLVMRSGGVATTPAARSVAD
jgi:hypothetical protein